MMYFFLHTRCRGSMLALFSGYLHFHFALEACIKGYQTVSLFAHAFATKFVHYVSDIVDKTNH